MRKLNNIELNVLAVALDHMEEHLDELAREHGGDRVDTSMLQARINAVEELRINLL